MRHWFKDQHFRSLLKNTGYLGVSKIVAAICGVATLALAGRGLGVLLFGTLILITSYVKAVSGIAKFQSWQLIVRYGGHGLSQGDPEHFKVATGFAFALDVVSGVGGKSLIGLLFGKAFLAAYEPLLVLMLVPVIGVLSFPLAPMLYALGKAGGPLRAKLIASLVFFISLAPLSLEWGVVGAAVAFVLASAVNVGVMIFQVAGQYRRLRMT